MHVNDSIRKLIENFKITEEIYSGNILFNEPIAPRTTFNIGGIAPVLFEPFDEKSLICLISFLKKNNLDFFILGGGSNLVVSDEGFAGICCQKSFFGSETGVIFSCSAGFSGAAEGASSGTGAEGFGASAFWEGA